MGGNQIGLECLLHIQESHTVAIHYRNRGVLPKVQIQAVALVGRGGVGAVIHFAGLKIVPLNTGIARPTSLGYSPTGSEVWVSNSSMIGHQGDFANLDAHSGQPLKHSGIWTMSLGDKIKLSSPGMGKFVVEYLIPKLLGNAFFSGS